MDHAKAHDQLEAGTGFMQGPLETMRALEAQGYTENLVLRMDHFERAANHDKAFPEDFHVDQVIRFEYTSDPDDQSVLYAISSTTEGWKGLFLESYGIYHEEMSQALIDKLRDHPALKQ